MLACWTVRVDGEFGHAPLPRAELLDHMPAFVDELIAALCPDAVPRSGASDHAVEHGAQRLRLGFDVAEVVREYGLLHHCILTLAEHAGLAIEIRELTIVSESLNHGIADAVRQYSSQRDVELRRQASAHLGFIAHEIRNPLSAARLALARLRQKEAAGGRGADLVDRNLRRIADTIESALVESSLELGVEAKREHLDVVAMLRDIERDAAFEAEARDIQIAVSSPADLRLAADPRLLRSALTNLVSNALKFSRAGSTIRLAVTPEGDMVAIEVADGCGGLPAGRAEELFAPLVQRGADRTGFGLGLAIALQATEAHGGKIDVRDVPGEGCVFRIVLPLGPPAPPTGG